MFDNEQEWTAALNVFCEKVPCTQDNRPMLYADITAILLNPEEVPCNIEVADISQILRSQMQQDSSESGLSAQCAAVLQDQE